MAYNFEWKDKIDDVDDASADDINSVAHAAKAALDAIEELSENLENEDFGGGEDGATFIPNVDADGNLSWTNNKGLKNPETVNIKGEDGIDGDEIGYIQAIPSPDGKSTEVEILVRKGDTGEIYRSTFTIPNGEDGETPFIGANGNWWIGTTDTGVKASGGADIKIDDKPTEGSNNAVSSGGVYEAIGDIETALDGIISLQEALIGGDSV